MPHSFHKWEQVHTEHVTDVKHSGDVMGTIYLPATSYSMTRSAVGYWWSGEKCPWRVTQDLHMLANSNLTAVRHWYKVFRAIIRPYAGAAGPGFLLVHDNAWPHVARVCRQFPDDKGIDAIDWPSLSPNMNPAENSWDIMYRSIWSHQVSTTDCPGSHWYPDSGLAGDPQDTICHLIRSMSIHCQECI